MNSILIPTLYTCLGITLYAAYHHAQLARHRAIRNLHALFAGMCFFISCLFFAKTQAYSVTTAQALVEWRRIDVSSAFLFFAIFPWFVAEYTGVRPRWFLISFSTAVGLLLIVNLSLPYGAAFSQLPELKFQALPWGERVADTRLLEKTVWYHIVWLMWLTVMIYAVYAALQVFHKGNRRRAINLFMTISLFILALVVTFLVNLEIVRFPHTGEFGFLAMVMLMSNRLSSELRLSERRMQEVLENVPAVVYLKDSQGRYIFANNHFQELFIKTNEQIIGKTDHDLFPAAHADAFRENDKRVLEAGHALEFEETAQVHGTQHIYTSIKFPVLSQDGTQYAVGGVSADVTALHNAEQELQALRKQAWHIDRVVRAGAITASIAHDMSQPLSAILSNTQGAIGFLEQDNLDQETLGSILHDIERDARRAAAVIRSMRTMMGRQHSPHVALNLKDCIYETLELMHGEFIKRGIECDTQCDSTVMVRGDQAQLQQVILNLIMNALEAMEQQSAGQRNMLITLKELTTDTVCLSVRDSGSGIAAEDLQSVFEPFWSSKQQGLGVGLSICKSIIEAHGGSLGMQPNADSGTTFYVELPIASEVPQTSTDTVREAMSIAHMPKATVYVIDDEEAVRKSIARMVKSNGWTVKTYASAESFLQEKHNEEAGCIITDVRMPGMSGTKMQEKLAAQKSTLPIIFLTGHGELNTAVAAFKQGAVDFLIKPVEEKTLLPLINKAITRHAQTLAITQQRQKATSLLEQLSTREREVLQHVLRGRLNKQIAADLGVVEKTIKVHRAHIMQKMGIHSVAELVHLCELTGLSAEQNISETVGITVE
jgi:PAS domain S-box-containing protein